MSNTADDYPEHTKLQAVKGESQAVGAFLDWLRNERGTNLVLCRVSPADEPSPYYAAPETTEQLLAEYYNIDLAALEAEKRRMLDAQRRLVEER